MDLNLESTLFYEYEGYHSLISRLKLVKGIYTSPKHVYEV